MQSTILRPTHLLWHGLQFDFSSSCQSFSSGTHDKSTLSWHSHKPRLNMICIWNCQRELRPSTEMERHTFSNYLRTCMDKNKQAESGTNFFMNASSNLALNNPPLTNASTIADRSYSLCTSMMASWHQATRKKLRKQLKTFDQQVAKSTTKEIFATILVSMLKNFKTDESNFLNHTSLTRSLTWSTYLSNQLANKSQHQHQRFYIAMQLNLPLTIVFTTKESLEF